MHSAITTLEAFREKIALPVESFHINDRYQLFVIPQPQPNTPFEIVGSFTFRTVQRTQSITRYYLLGQNGALYSTPQHDESRFVVALADAVESRWKSDSVKVEDVTLPRSHGFSIKRHNIARLKTVQ